MSAFQAWVYGMSALWCIAMLAIGAVVLVLNLTSHHAKRGSRRMVTEKIRKTSAAAAARNREKESA